MIQLEYFKFSSLRTSYLLVHFFQSASLFPLVTFDLFYAFSQFFVGTMILFFLVI